MWWREFKRKWVVCWKIFWLDHPDPIEELKGKFEKTAIKLWKAIPAKRFTAAGLILLLIISLTLFVYHSGLFGPEAPQTIDLVTGLDDAEKDDFSSDLVSC